MLFKITTQAEWQKAIASGTFKGSALDLKDGFIHLSTAAQAPETARLYFAEQTDLLLVAISEETVAKALKWEPSRGGQLFPHVYDAIDVSRVKWAKPLPWNGRTHDFPAEMN